MEHSLASQTQITCILSIYPSIILPKSAVVPEPEKLVDISVDDPYLSRASSSLSDEMETSPASQSDESVALESKKMSHNASMDLIKFLQKKRYSFVERAAAEELKRLSTKSTKARVSIAIRSGAREMAAILDTTLLQALLLTGQSSAVVDLLKDINYCEICKDFLQKRSEYFALLELYKSNGMHCEAVNLLHHLIEDSKSDKPQIECSQNFKPEMIIDNLKVTLVIYHMLSMSTCDGNSILIYDY